MPFDPQAALRKIENRTDTPATSATLATFHPGPAPKVAKIAEVAAPQAQNQEKDASHPPAATDDFKHGFSICGRPKTWTGKIVSMEEWHQLSAWDKHGPDGRMFNGLTQRWEHPKDAVAHAQALADQEQKAWDDACFCNTQF